MSVDQDLLELLIRNNDKENPLDYRLHLDDSVFSLVDVSIANSPIPVNEPTTRGGVYFSDKFAYKMKGVIKDLLIVPLLTRNMLGPNTDFGDLKITTKIKSNKASSIEIFTNLTNSIQTPDSIELGMIIVRVESV